MKTTLTIASLLLIAVAIIAVGSSAREFQRRRVAEADAATEIQRRNDLQRQARGIAAARADASPSQQKSDGVGSSHHSERKDAMAAARAHAISSESKAGGPARTADDQVRSQARPLSTDPLIITATDPDLRILNVKIEEALVELDWGPLFALLKLSPERIEQFKRLRMALRQDSMEYEALADTKPLGMNDPEIRKQVGAGLRATEQQMRELLSPEEFRIYDAYYKRERYVSATVSQLASELYFTEAPLSAQQGLRLMQMFAENTPRGTGPHGFILDLNANQLHTNIDGALAQMTTPEFSPVQIAMVRKLREQQQVRREIDAMLSAVIKRYPGVEKRNLSYWTPSLPPPPRR
jgi:hypothetical protein